MNIPEEAITKAAQIICDLDYMSYEETAIKALEAAAPFIAAQALRNVADDEPNWLWNIICGETCVKGIERVDHDAIADQVRDAIRIRAAELETK